MDELPAGAYTLSVGQRPTEELWGGRGQPSWRSTNVVDLEAAEQRDVGVIDPDEGCIEGRVAAEFSLLGAMVSEARTSSAVRLASDGSFQLCDLPDDVALSLRLRVPGRGVYETAVEAGGTLTWELEIRDDD